jgi:hypothetical protein
LLPDPGDARARQKLVERIGGTLDAEGTKTTGGVLRWGRESTPDMEFFRAEIKKAYGGRAPRCWTCSRAAVRSRWKRCGWAAT